MKQRSIDHICSSTIGFNTVWLEKIWQAGVPAVEIFCARQHLDYRDSAQINELGHWFRDSELKLHSLHSPMYSDDIWGRSGPNSYINITEPVKSKRLLMLDEIKRALDIADVIPFRYLIQHIGVQKRSTTSTRWKRRSRRSRRSICLRAERGVEVLLENIPNQLSSAERLVHVSGPDAPEDELLPGCRPRQHEGRHFDGLHDYEGAASGPRICTTTTARRTATCGRSSPKAAPSTGRRPWSCCAHAGRSIRCCWNCGNSPSIRFPAVARHGEADFREARDI